MTTAVLSRIAIITTAVRNWTRLTGSPDGMRRLPASTEADPVPDSPAVGNIAEPTAALGRLP